MNVLYWLHYASTFVYLLLLSVFVYIKTCIVGNCKRAPPLTNKQGKIAIIGAGIGGMSAAYALVHSGYTDVTIYEARDEIGGNAKTHIWYNDGDKSSNSVTTGLSVLAWPVIFRNYIRLLRELKIETTVVELPFMIHNDEDNSVFAHGKQRSYTQQYNKDLNRWNRMVNAVRFATELLCGKEASLYHLSFLHPFNFISFRALSMLFGVSNRFWHNVVVPMYASSFLTTKLSLIPASILPVVDSIISLQPNRIPTLQTWLTTSVDVFKRMSKGVTIRTNCRVQNVRIERQHNSQIAIQIDHHPIVYDRVIFACSADAALHALTKGNADISPLLKTILDSVTYADDDDTSLIEGIIHRDINILPTEYADELCHNYANYIRVKRDTQNKVLYHYNTFILSSWVPNIQANERHRIEPMFVTYSPLDQPAPKIDARKVYGKVDNRRAHPNLSFRNQAISFLLRLVQGENGVYFCGNASTPANGHDLSLLSGFAVAEQIGAEYPFSDDQATLRDFNRFKRMCVN